MEKQKQIKGSGQNTSLKDTFSMLLAAADEHEVKLEVIFAILAKRGAAFIIFVLAFLIFLPFALFPGFAALLAAMIGVTAVNLIWGTEKVWLPKRFLMLRVPGAMMAKAIRKMMPLVCWLDHNTGNRLVWIVEGHLSDQLAGATIILLALSLIILGFIPFAGFIALPIMLLAAGLFVRDGLVHLVGYLLTILVLILLTWAGFFAASIVKSS